MSGYTQAELDDVQAKWGLRFPPDLLAVYSERRQLITFDKVDWITSPPETIRKLIDWPLEGFLFDVRLGLWQPEWGQQPGTADEAEEAFRAIFEHAPKMIPVYGHRCLPEEPYESGNPVFSVWQMDTILYGANLGHWMTQEGKPSSDEANWPSVKEIPFWSAAVRWRANRGHGPFVFYDRDGILPKR